MSDMWMPAHTTTPPLRTRRNALGTNSPTGAKIMAASQFLRHVIFSTPGPDCTKGPGKLLSCGVSRTGYGKHLTPLPTRNLSENVGGITKTVEPQTARVAGHPEGAIANQPRAQQGCSLQVGIFRG